MESSIVAKQKLTYQYNEKHPGAYVSLARHENFIDITSDNESVLRVQLLTEKIIRIRYAVRPYFPKDFSYAIDPEFKSETVQYQIKENHQKIVISTSLLKIEIIKSHLFVNFYDNKGKQLSSDEKGFHWEKDERHGGEIVKMSKTSLPDEAYFGLGDKTSNQNIRGKRFVNWSTDEYGYKGDTDPLYKNINLIYSFHKGSSYGLFFDNTFKSHFDLAHERKEVISFWAEGGEMNYYFFYGEDLLDVARQYTNLTGTADMPPLWALGYQQCKWSYYPESKVMEVANRMRAEKIPCDAMYLDIDYMDGFRCFTWNKEHFPDPKRMVQELKNDGFKTMVIIDPGIKIDFDYDVFKEGLEKGYFCKRQDGPYVQGKVWPGECYFPDFTNPEVREWWGGLFQELIEDIGLAGIWNDMNEPALFEVPTKTFPLDVRHDYDGHPCSHRKAHNIYGMQMTKATADGVKRFAGNKRPLLITRSGYAGMQRFTSVWTGDNLASWEHLKMAHMQTLRLSISGVSFCGSDIGGFIDQPEGELYVRWMQLAIFHPFFRTHSSGDHGDQEPWSFGKKNLNLVRKLIELRYRILPYIYSCFYEYHKHGTPILRPILFQTASKKKGAINNSEEAFLGDHLLYSPVLKKGALKKEVTLPEGNWYDYFENIVYAGNNSHVVDADLGKVPLFVRAGAIIPHFPTMQYVGEHDINEVTLKVYYGSGIVSSKFYSDALDGYEYKDNQYRLTEFTTESTASKLVVSQSFEQEYIPTFASYKVQIFGIAGYEVNIELDGNLLEKCTISEDHTIEFAVDRDFKTISIKF